MVIDATLGYPPLLVRWPGHPVMAAGALLSWLEARLNRPEWSEPARFAAGVATLTILLGATLAVTVPIVVVCKGFQWGWPVEAVLASTLLAQRSLRDHVAAVAEGLNTGLAGGRRAVARIVGRDPETLDEAGVARAAIESLAENFSDGVIAPAFWLLLGGLPGIALYKAINTADSMIGHRSSRYNLFGRAAARLDDLVNLPSARLTALLIALAAMLTPDASPEAALAAAWRDAGKHRSPNAGWPEAAMAGALGLQLAGPRVYAGETVDDAWMGHGRSNANAGDIERALELYRRAGLITMALAAGAYAWLSGW